MSNYQIYCKATLQNYFSPPFLFLYSFVKIARNHNKFLFNVYFRIYSYVDWKISSSTNAANNVIGFRVSGKNFLLGHLIIARNCESNWMVAKNKNNVLT